MSAVSKPRYMEKYNRQKLIGSGAFGQAWLVQAKVDGKQLVMKEIKIGKVSHRFHIKSLENLICFHR